jgi:hypothetical protein
VDRTLWSRLRCISARERLSSSRTRSFGAECQLPTVGGRTLVRLWATCSVLHQKQPKHHGKLARVRDPVAQAWPCSKSCARFIEKDAFFASCFEYGTFIGSWYMVGRAESPRQARFYEQFLYKARLAYQLQTQTPVFVLLNSPLEFKRRVSFGQKAQFVSARELNHLMMFSRQWISVHKCLLTACFVQTQSSKHQASGFRLQGWAYFTYVTVWTWSGLGPWPLRGSISGFRDAGAQPLILVWKISPLSRNRAVTVTVTDAGCMWLLSILKGISIKWMPFGIVTHKINKVAAQREPVPLRLRIGKDGHGHAARHTRWRSRPS